MQATAAAPTDHAPQSTPDRAPLPDEVRAQIEKDTSSVRALQLAARRRGDSDLTVREAQDEIDAAREHFELGCWLAWYADRVGRPEGLQDRIDCVARLLRAGIDRPGYDFYTAFRFGERQFDTCFEMGDADAVVAGLYARSETDAQLATALARGGIERWG